MIELYLAFLVCTTQSKTLRLFYQVLLTVGGESTSNGYPSYLLIDNKICMAKNSRTFVDITTNVWCMPSQESAV